MAIECAYSFDDLYQAAYGKPIDISDKEKFQARPQEEINTMVRSWVKKAGWMMEERAGSDGKTYLAFAPHF